MNEEELNSVEENKNNSINFTSEFVRRMKKSIEQKERGETKPLEYVLKEYGDAVS